MYELKVLKQRLPEILIVSGRIGCSIAVIGWKKAEFCEIGATTCL